MTSVTLPLPGLGRSLTLPVCSLITVASLASLRPFWGALLHLALTFWTSHCRLAGLEEVLDALQHSVPTSALLTLKPCPSLLWGHPAHCQEVNSCPG